MKKVVSQKYKIKKRNNDNPSFLSVIICITIIIFLVFVLNKLSQKAIDTCVEITGNRTECIKKVSE